MQSLDALKNLLFRLKKDELKSLEKFILAYQDDASNPRAKSLELVKIIFKNRELTSKEILPILYPNRNKVAFDKLVKRLYSKILEILLFDINLTNNKYSPRNQAIFSLRKKMIQTDILNLRGIDEEIEQHVNKIIQKARKFEAYDILLNALYTKQKYLYTHGNKNRFDKVKREISDAENRLISYNRSENLYNEMLKHITLNEKASLTNLTLSSAISIIESDFIATESALIGFYLYMLKTEYSQRENKYVESLQSLLKLKEITLKNESVYTKNRYGTILLNIANNYLLINDFFTCDKYLDESEILFADIPINLSLVKEIRFFSELNQGKFIEANGIITNLVTDTKSGTSIMMGKRKYYLAVVNFLFNKFDQSVELLNSLDEIEKDKEGWNFGIKLMLLLNYFEMKDLERIESSIQSVEKFIKRVKNKSQLNQRFLLFFKIFRSLLINNVDYDSTYKQQKKIFLRLDSDPSLKWYIKGPELMNITNWFRSKIRITNMSSDQIIRSVNSNDVN